MTKPDCKVLVNRTPTRTASFQMAGWPQPLTLAEVKSWAFTVQEVDQTVARFESGFTSAIAAENAGDHWASNHGYDVAPF